MHKVADWNEGVTAFISEYVEAPPGSFTQSGALDFTTIRAAASVLLTEKVFDSKQDMRVQAVKDYGIILPEMIFE